MFSSGTIAAKNRAAGRSEKNGHIAMNRGADPQWTTFRETVDGIMPRSANVVQIRSHATAPSAANTVHAASRQSASWAIVHPRLPTEAAAATYRPTRHTERGGALGIALGDAATSERRFGVAAGATTEVLRGGGRRNENESSSCLDNRTHTTAVRCVSPPCVVRQHTYRELIAGLGCSGVVQTRDL